MTNSSLGIHIRYLCLVYGFAKRFQNEVDLSFFPKRNIAEIILSRIVCSANKLHRDFVLHY